MPEGHTLHRLASAMTAAFAGEPVRASSPQGRFADSAARLEGRPLSAAWSYGKHLFVEFDGPDVLHVHLGLYGRFDVLPGAAPPPVGLVRLRLVGVRAYADLRGPTACELLTPAEVETLLARLGPDPLRDDARPERGWSVLHGSRRSLASLLMDQAVAAGIGNVYRAEILFRHRLDPAAPGHLVVRGVWDDLWADLVVLMRRGVETGRIDTVRPEHEPERMRRPPRTDRGGGEVYVYRRTGQPCLVCGTSIRTGVVDGRNLYWCPGCQRRGGRRRLGTSQTGGGEQRPAVGDADALATAQLSEGGLGQADGGPAVPCHDLHPA